MKSVSLAIAVSLTGWSERTFWRKCQAGGMQYEIRGGKSSIPFELIAGHITLPLADEDLHIIELADAGNADAQNDFGLLLLAHARPKSALRWLKLAARQEHANAMQELGRCYITGLGTSRDEHLGMMWIARAAAAGHCIARGQIDEMFRCFTAQAH